MPIRLGVLCSDESPELAALIRAVAGGRVSAEIGLVIADRDRDPLFLAREAGLYGVFIPRSAFHANRDGYERRLVEMMRQAGVEAVVLAGFGREIGPVLRDAFPDRIWGPFSKADQLAADLEKKLRGALFQVVP